MTSAVTGRSSRYPLRRKLELQFEEWRFLLRDLGLRFRRRAVDFDQLALPPLEGSMPERAASGRLQVFTACDTGYFDNYFPKFFLSLALYSPDVAVHLHLFNPPDMGFLDQIAALARRCPHLPVTCSWESADLRGRDRIYRVTYFASMRFLRLHQLMSRTGADVLSLDVDTLVRGDLRQLTDFMHDSDISFMSRFSHPDPKRKLLAGVIYLRHTDAALAYLKRVALRIAKHLLEPAFKVEWYLDQRILFLEYLRQKKRRDPPLRWKRLEKRFIDWHYDNESVIWVGKGRRKDENRLYIALGEKVLNANS